MKTITLRGIDDETAAILKKQAKDSCTSVNATVLNLIRESVGLEKKNVQGFTMIWMILQEAGVRRMNRRLMKQPNLLSK